MIGPLRPAVFLDRDGTLMEEVEYCRDPAKVRLFSGVIGALDELRAAGFATVIITNQSGIGRGWITEAEYASVHARLLELLGAARIDSTYYCPDPPGVESLFRKPAPGMVLQAARELRLNLERSWFVGDKAADIHCGRNAGTRSILVRTGYGRTENSEGAESAVDSFAEAARYILDRLDRITS